MDILDTMGGPVDPIDWAAIVEEHHKASDVDPESLTIDEEAEFFHVTATAHAVSLASITPSTIQSSITTAVQTPTATEITQTTQSDGVAQFTPADSNIPFHQPSQLVSTVNSSWVTPLPSIDTIFNRPIQTTLSNLQPGPSTLQQDAQVQPAPPTSHQSEWPMISSAASSSASIAPRQPVSHSYPSINLGNFHSPDYNELISDFQMLPAPPGTPSWDLPPPQQPAQRQGPHNGPSQWIGNPHRDRWTEDGRFPPGLCAHCCRFSHSMANCPRRQEAQPPTDPKHGFVNWRRAFLKWVSMQDTPIFIPSEFKLDIDTWRKAGSTHPTVLREQSYSPTSTQSNQHNNQEVDYYSSYNALPPRRQSPTHGYSNVMSSNSHEQQQNDRYSDRQPDRNDHLPNRTERSRDRARRSGSPNRRPRRSPDRERYRSKRRESPTEAFAKPFSKTARSSADASAQPSSKNARSSVEAFAPSFSKLSQAAPLPTEPFAPTLRPVPRPERPAPEPLLSSGIRRVNTEAAVSQESRATEIAGWTKWLAHYESRNDITRAEGVRQLLMRITQPTPSPALLPVSAPISNVWTTNDLTRYLTVNNRVRTIDRGVHYLTIHPLQLNAIDLARYGLDAVRFEVRLRHFDRKNAWPAFASVDLDGSNRRHVHLDGLTPDERYSVMHRLYLVSSDFTTEWVSQDTFTMTEK